MFTNQTKTSRRSSMSKWFRRVPWLVIPVMLFAFSIANAQQLTGTLSGIATDQTDARVPGAKSCCNKRRQLATPVKPRQTARDSFQ